MKRLYLIILICLLALTASAQELTVKEMKATNDISASQYRVNDLNGQPCALVKVQLATRGAKFAGSVIGTPEFKNGVYWVYMPAGVKELEVQHNSFVPCHVTFSDYGIQSLQSLTTYVLTLLMPQGGAVPVDDGMRYLALTVSPKNSTVYVDGQLQVVDADGSVSVYLPQGQHSYRVEAAGYAPEQQTVTLGDETLVRSVTLQSVLARVTVSCPTTGARIFVNGQQRGTTPWSGSLAAGNYKMEARLDGYHSQQQTVTIAERSNEQITLPALVAITGNLNVNYRPVGAEVWMDGKQLGATPNVFRGVIVGSHSVEVRKAGYETLKQSVTIAEGQTAQLSGTLTASASLQSATSSSSSSVSSAAVETITVNGVSFNMVRVDGGTFTMGGTSEQGSDAGVDEKPAHQVTLSTYSIGETEVTQALWQAVMGSNPSDFKGDNLPVEQVSWDDCQTFISKLNTATGKRFRLPTEAEWEYAARGGSKSRGYKYSGSNTIGDVAWFHYNSGRKTHNVKTKQPNELGLYDMSGNVEEWCQDWYDSYSSGSKTNPTGPSSGSYRVHRGACWNNYARFCRSSHRGSLPPSIRIHFLGLRLAF